MRTHRFGVGQYDKLINKLNALRKGKRVMETIRNPDLKQTNKPFIRVQIERS